VPVIANRPEHGQGRVLADAVQRRVSHRFGTFPSGCLWPGRCCHGWPARIRTGAGGCWIHRLQPRRRPTRRS